jgi:hypothetical protein
MELTSGAGTGRRQREHEPPLEMARSTCRRVARSWSGGIEGVVVNLIEDVRDALCILNRVPNGDVAHLVQATASAQISPPANASNDKSGGDAARVLGLDGADVVDDVRDQDRPRRRRSMRASSKPTALAAASTVAPCPIRCSARSTRSTCW